MCHAPVPSRPGILAASTPTALVTSSQDERLDHPLLLLLVVERLQVLQNQHGACAGSGSSQVENQNLPRIADIKTLIDAARAVQEAAQIAMKVDAGLKRAVEELVVAARKVEEQMSV